MPSVVPEKSRYILNVRVDVGLKMDEVIQIIDSRLMTDGKCHLICTTNPEFILSAQKDNEFKDIINDSSLSLPDGVGICMAIKYLDIVSSYKKDAIYPVKCLIAGIYVGIGSVLGFVKLNDTITGVSLVNKLAELANMRKYSMFLLGGHSNVKSDVTGHMIQDVAIEASNYLKTIYPNINILGTNTEYSSNINDDSATITYINNIKQHNNTKYIDILLVAYAHNKQEKWINRNKEIVNSKISVGVGGTFDYLSSYKKQPPTMYEKKYLGWLYRLITQPYRYRRVFNAVVLFPIKVFTDSIKSK